MTSERKASFSKRSLLNAALLMMGVLILFLCTMRAENVHAASFEDLYIAKAQEVLNNTPEASFYLAELDGDGIPELIVNYGTVAGSEELFFLDGDHLGSWMYEYYAFHYIPGSDLIRISGGRMGQYYDEIYRKAGSDFILLASGTYVSEDGTLDRDSNGSIILNDKLSYTWMEQPVSADTYLLALQSVYDLDLDETPYGQGFDLTSLIDVLRSGGYTAYFSPAAEPAPGLDEEPLWEADQGADPDEEPLWDVNEAPDPGPAADPAAAPASYDLEFASSDVSDYPNVRLYFSLDDEYGQPITLSSFDGAIKETIENGAEIERTIRRIERLEGNQGISIDIVADKSGSMDYDLPVMQNIMSDFVRSLDYSVGDQVEILSFDSYVMYMCTYTQDVSLLLNGISNMTAYGDTALYDALITGINNAASRAGARCVIGFTDGLDNRSVYTPDEVIYLAQQKEVPVYLIGTGSADSGILSYIANATGGYYWDAYSITDISDILSLIYRNQKDMYCIEYESDPAADPYWRRMINCWISDGRVIGRADRVDFQATPVVQTAPHSSRYELVKADVSWQQANDACIAKGGHLVTISSQAEMDVLVQMCENAGIKYCWIGGYTSVRNNVAFGHWITGENFDFTSWYPGEPSRNDLDGTPEFYLMLWKVENAWSWNDQRNDVVADYDYFKGIIGYICEYED